jgi:Na+/H+-dicarboxylate symporter
MRKISLNSQILIGCLIGIAGGWWLSGAGSTPMVANTLYGAKLVGTLFLDLLRMVLIPWFSRRLSLASPICVPIKKCTGYGSPP